MTTQIPDPGEWQADPHARGGLHPPQQARHLPRRTRVRPAGIATRVADAKLRVTRSYGLHAAPRRRREGGRHE